MPKQRVVRHAVTQPLDKPYRFIPLTQRQNAIVDIGDFEWLNQWNWCAVWDSDCKSFRAFRKGGVRAMHRFIMECSSKEEQVDHKNHDTLDNRRENLRKCSKDQNAKNRRARKIIKGVHFHKRLGKWEARIRVGKKNHYLGLFLSQKDAAIAYDKAATKYFGEFACLNYAIPGILAS